MKFFRTATASAAAVVLAVLFAVQAHAARHRNSEQ
jgi:hypothetical protein